MATTWYTRKYSCRNGVEERTKYPVTIRAGASKRERESAAVRAARQSDSAERCVARLLNNNFTEREDLHIVLEYDDAAHGQLVARARERCEAEGREFGADDIMREADRALSNWVRRVQRRMGESSRFLYIGVTSDMDGDALEPVRIHHHVIINRECEAACLEKWTGGYVWHDQLFCVRGDFSRLAAYLINQVRHIKDRKRYVPSRFLAQPRVSRPIAVTRYGESEMRPPKGAILLYRAPFVRGQSQYIRYLARRE